MATAAPTWREGHTDKHGIAAVAETQRWTDALESLIDDLEPFSLRGKSGASRDGRDSKRERSSVQELSFHTPAPPLYTSPPPSYDDAIGDLPPDYATCPPLAERRTVIFHAAPAMPVEKSRDQPSAFWKDGLLNVGIDFQSPIGVREHKKKKGGTNKKPVATTPAQASGGGSDNAGEETPPADGDGGDAGGGDGGEGAGGGGDGGGDDGGEDWNDWSTPGSKKKTKKQKEEEEEQERLAKEEEERKAAEAPAGNNLSWADDLDDNGGDDSWAGFEGVGKKKKKGKVWLPGCICLL